MPRQFGKQNLFVGSARSLKNYTRFLVGMVSISCTSHPSGSSYIMAALAYAPEKYRYHTLFI